MRLKDKVILITASTRGIGHAILACGDRTNKATAKQRWLKAAKNISRLNQCFQRTLS